MRTRQTKFDNLIQRYYIADMKNFDVERGYRFTITKEVSFEVWARSDEEALDLAKLVDLNKGTVLETRLTDEDQMDIIQREAWL